MGLVCLTACTNAEDQVRTQATIYAQKTLPVSDSKIIGWKQGGECIVW